MECIPTGNKETDEKKEKRKSTDTTQKKKACQEQGVEEEDHETGGSPPKRVYKTQKEKLKEFKKGVAKCIWQMKSNYYNPDPMVRLIGEATEPTIRVDNYLVKALIDSGAQVSTMTKSLSRMMGLKVHKLTKLLTVEGTGGGTVPYHGYVEVELMLPEVKDFKECILMLVIDDSEYGQRVPIQLGTLHIDMILDQATPSELATLGRTWERGKLGRNVINKQAQVEGFDLDSIEGPVKITEHTVLKAGETLKMQGMIEVRGNFKRINITIEPLGLKEMNMKEGVGAISTYAVCKAGSSRVSILLRNQTRQDVQLKKGQVVARAAAANLIPNKIAPRYRPEDRTYAQVYAREMESRKRAYALRKKESQEQRTNDLLDKLDLTGMEDWTGENQERAKKIFSEFNNVFALNSMELGKTSLVKHVIKLDNPVPFKEQYRRIPPHQFEEVQKHLKEMEDIGAIRRSNSAWTSPVVLVRKKDGSLRFCIDLWKLNARTIKDAYSLPRIEESLDCLNGSQIFSSLDLKSGYWQVELEEESIPLTAFMVGPLGFYECVRMPFRLTNAPATFQRLMESCLGELELVYHLSG